MGNTEMERDGKMEQIKISVRALVEFLLRSGDIDNRRKAAAQKEDPSSLVAKAVLCPGLI